MDFLGLTNDFMIETGVSDTAASLVDAPDDVIQASHWINRAWGLFQLAKKWPFKRAEITKAITNGKTSYTFQELGIQEGDLIFPKSFYNANGTIEQLTYYALRDKRRAAGNVDTTKISHVAVKSGKLETYPDVDTTQNLEFDIWLGVQNLVVNTDIPYGLPADFHPLIVHFAVAQYGALNGGDEGANLYSHHGKSYAVYLNRYMTLAGIDSEEDVTRTAGTLL